MQEGQNASHREAGGIDNNHGVALKESPKKSIALELQPNLIKIQAQELIKKKQWKSIEKNHSHLLHLFSLVTL